MFGFPWVTVNDFLRETLIWFCNLILICHKWSAIHSHHIEEKGSRQMKRTTDKRQSRLCMFFWIWGKISLYDGWSTTKAIMDNLVSQSDTEPIGIHRRVERAVNKPGHIKTRPSHAATSACAAIWTIYAARERATSSRGGIVFIYCIVSFVPQVCVSYCTLTLK